MLDRIVRGTVPSKHHIAFRKDTNQPISAENLHWEECFTRTGFDGPYTILYHQNRPHEQQPIDTHETYGWSKPIEAPSRGLLKKHFLSQNLEPKGGCPLNARVPMIFNDDICISIAHPSSPDPVYFNNADADDLLFIFRGSGVLRSVMGDLRFEADDYVYIPKGLVYRLIPDKDVEQYWLCVECYGGMNLLKQWRNEVGQLTMDAPYCHRDFRRPELSKPQDEGIRTTVVKRNGDFYAFTQPHSPLDVVGWDGTVYPWVFPILNFQPRAGLVHLPPTWHGTFATRNSLICSFVPRAVDFHPQAIPCPYPHSSVDCDEFLFYCRGNFTSRRGVGPGSISLHPMGLPHGPHPGAYEASVGHKTSSELAVMIDTFKPMLVTQAAVDLEDEHYQNSFVSR